MRLDAHQFFTEQHKPSHLESIVRRARFDGSIAVAQSGDDNERLFGLAATHTFLRGVIARVDLDDPRLEDLLDGFARQPRFCGAVGTGFQPGTGNPAGLRSMEQRAIPLDVLTPAGEIPILLDRHPDLGIAIVHLGLPDGSDVWFRAMERAAQSPRVYVKASGLITAFPKPWSAQAVRPYVQHALAVFGPRRVMFGSDWPACLPDSIWKETLAIFTQAIGPQTAETREWLLGESARAFYRIGVPRGW